MGWAKSVTVVIILLLPLATLPPPAHAGALGPVTDYQVSTTLNGFGQHDATWASAAGAYSLPWAFPLYANTHSSLRFEPEGYLRFDTGSSTDFQSMVVVAPAYRPEFVVVDRSVAVGPLNSWVAFRWTVVQPTQNTNPTGSATFDAILFIDGRIRFDYGLDTLQNTAPTRIGVQNPPLSQNIQEISASNLYRRDSLILTPGFQDTSVFKASILRPKAGGIYSGGQEASQVASHAVVSGAITFTGSAIAPVQTLKASEIKIFVGDQLVASGTSTNSLTGTWQPPSAAWLFYVARVIVTDSAGQESQAFIDLFAHSSVFPVDQLKTSVVQITSPNGGELIGENWVVDLFVFSIADSVSERLDLSLDGGISFQIPLLTGVSDGPRATPMKFVFSRQYVDTYEGMLKATIDGGSDTSDAIFTVDTNGIAGRVNVPTTGLTNGFFTSPVQLGLSTWQADSGQAWTEFKVDDGPLIRAQANIDEFENARGWRVETVPVYLADPYVVPACSPPATLNCEPQGVNALRFDYLAPGDEPSVAVLSRSLEDPIEFSKTPGGNQRAFNEMSLRFAVVTEGAFFAIAEAKLLNAAGTTLSTLTTADSVRADGVWTTVHGTPPPAGTATTLELRLWIDPSASTGTGAAPVSWFLDDLHLANTNVLRVATEGIHSVKARTHGSPFQAPTGYHEDSAEKILMIDLNPPTGSVSINGGADLTNTNLVTLTLAATDTVSWVSEMRISNDERGGDAQWIPFQTSLPWALEPLDPVDPEDTAGIRSVFVWYRDQAGHPMIEPTRDDILVDVQGPSTWWNYVPGPDTWQTNATPWVSIDVADNVGLDYASGSAQFCLISCSTAGARSFEPIGTDGRQGRLTVVAPTMSMNGDWAVRFTARDTAGNSVTTPSHRLRVDFTPPTVNPTVPAALPIGANRFVNNPTITVSMGGADAQGGSGLASGALSLDPVVQASDFFAYTANRAFALDPSDGKQRVYAWTRDVGGLTSARGQVDVVLDRRGPIVTPVSPPHQTTFVDPADPLNPLRIKGNWADDTSQSAIVSGVATASASIILRDRLNGLETNLTASCTLTVSSFDCPAVTQHGRAYDVVATVKDPLGNGRPAQVWWFTTKPIL